MNGWRESTWGDEISLEYGKGIRNYADSDGPYRVYGSNGPVGWTSDALAPGPGVVLGRKGAYRGVRFSKEPFFVIDTAYYVVPKSDLDMRWLYYAIIYHKLGEIDDGSPIPSTTRTAVYVRDLSVPPKSEQQNIASVLGALDDKIELNRQMNETLEAMARVIFKDWFVDFGPTRAKMEGRMPYLAPDVWSLFPDRLDDEGKPEGWVETPLSSIFNIIGGGTPKTSIDAYWNGDIPWFSVVDTPSGGDLFVFKTEKTITKLGLAESSACLIPEDTTIISARGTVGNLAIAAQDMTFNQSCYALQGKPSFGPYFVFLTAKNMVSELKSMSHGSVFSTITRSTFEAVTSTQPTKEILKIFEKTIDPIFSKIRENANQSQILSDDRDLLLPKLMSGEVQVRDAAKILETIA